MNVQNKIIALFLCLLMGLLNFKSNNLIASEIEVVKEDIEPDHILIPVTLGVIVLVVGGITIYIVAKNKKNEENNNIQRCSECGTRLKDEKCNNPECDKFGTPSPAPTNTVHVTSVSIQSLNDLSNGNWQNIYTENASQYLSLNDSTMEIVEADSLEEWVSQQPDILDLSFIATNSITTNNSMFFKLVESVVVNN